MRLTIKQGDITTFRTRPPAVGAIVNAANITLVGGGGVDGAIHRAAGPGLRAECEKLPILPTSPAPGGSVTRCMTGDARLTPAADLPVDYVIHAVGPIFPSPSARPPVHHGEFVCKSYDEARSLLRKAINACFTLALAKGVTHLAFPAISCGVFGCTIPTFAKALHDTMQAIEGDGHLLPATTVYLFDPIDFATFSDTWNTLTGGSTTP